LLAALVDPMGALGLVLVLVVVMAALGADLAPYSPSKLAPADRFAAPNLSHLLGGDHLGRDLFTRVLHGARIALWVALVSTGISLVGGLVLGMAAGYGARWLDSALLLLFDALRSFPTVMLALALVTLTGPSLGAVIAVVVIATLPGYARVVRAQTMTLKNREFVLAAQALGRLPAAHHAPRHRPQPYRPAPSPGFHGHPSSNHHRGRHELPRAGRPAAHALLGHDPQRWLRLHPESPWPAIAGGLPIVIATLGFTFLGESLRDRFDPRLRRES